MAEATLDTRHFLSSVGMRSREAPRPVVEGRLEGVRDASSDEDRFVSALAAFVWNVDPSGGRLAGGRIQDVVLRIDELVAAQLDEIVHCASFQSMESAWRGLEDLVTRVNFHANVMVDILDVSKDELFEDLENSTVDPTASSLFRRIYVDEYDQFGGKPFGALVGLYEFGCTPRDILWLRVAGKIAATAHVPLVAAVAPSFFGCETAEQVAAITDLEGLLRHPRYAAWHGLRDSSEAGYLALVLPRYLLRKRWHPEENPTGDLVYVEDPGADGKGWLWGNAAILFARNLVRAFEQTGWCQNIRGPKGGGLVTGLPLQTFAVRDERVAKPPIEFALPDYGEIAFANAGFIPLVARPHSNEACFFSSQSLKAPKRFKDARESERAQLHTNLAYTLSIARIAHYLKCIVRDNVGTTADAPYVQRQIKTWLEEYVTTVANPDDLTLSFYPFKSAKVAVERADGVVGKFNALVAVVPHIQFEGIDVELRLESRLG